MAQHFTEDIIEKVREATNIVALISEYVHLKKAGSSYKGLCPFHMEKTPSFSVDSKRQIFKCFGGCSKAGNVFHFLMEIENISFPEAVTFLAQKHGIEIAPIEKREEKKNRGIMEVLSWSAMFFQRNLTSRQGRAAKRYLKSRHLTKETMEHFQIGYAPDSWDDLLKDAQAEGFELEILLEAGLVTRNEKGKVYDRFRDRLMFPIWNSQGKIIAFGGRVLNSEKGPKYLNSPETSLFSKKRLLYAFHMARSHFSKTKELCIMEGYTDVLMAHQNNFCCTVATLGTALTPEHVALIKKYTDNVVLVFDGDSAGMKAATRSIGQFLGRGIMVKVVILPKNIDPCEFLTSHGADAFQALKEKAEDFFDFQIRLFNHQYDMKTSSAKRKAIGELTQMVAQIPDVITKRLFASRISETFQIPMQNLLADLGLQKRINAPVAHKTIHSYRDQLQLEHEKHILQIILKVPHRAKEILPDYPPGSFQDPKHSMLAQHIVQALEQNQTIEINSLASQLDPELGQKLVDIYFDQLKEMDEEEIERQLNLIKKGVERKKYHSKIHQMKQLLQTQTNDTNLENEILTSVQSICKNRFKNKDSND